MVRRPDSIQTRLRYHSRGDGACTKTAPHSIDFPFVLIVAIRTVAGFMQRRSRVSNESTISLTIAVLTGSRVGC